MLRRSLMLEAAALVTGTACQRSGEMSVPVAVKDPQEDEVKSEPINDPFELMRTAVGVRDEMIIRYLGLGSEGQFRNHLIELENWSVNQLRQSFKLNSTLYDRRQAALYGRYQGPRPFQYSITGTLEFPQELFTVLKPPFILEQVRLINGDQPVVQKLAMLIVDGQKNTAAIEALRADPGSRNKAERLGDLYKITAEAVVAFPSQYPVNKELIEDEQSGLTRYTGLRMQQRLGVGGGKQILEVNFSTGKMHLTIQH